MVARTVALVRQQTRLLRMAWLTTWAVGAADVVSLFVKDKIAVTMRWKAEWARGAPSIVGLDIHVAAGSSARTSRGRLVIANHRSPLDIVALFHLFEEGHFLANHRVAGAPIVGRGARRIGTVFVDREDRRSGVGAIRTMRRILEQGGTVIVFPEGTTFGGDEVRPFKGGAFTAASGLDVDILPVGVAYTPGHELAEGRTGAHVRGFLRRRRTPVWVAIGEPIAVPSVGKKDIESVVRASVQGLVDVARGAATDALAEQTPKALSTPTAGTEHDR